MREKVRTGILLALLVGIVVYVYYLNKQSNDNLSAPVGATTVRVP